MADLMEYFYSWGLLFVLPFTVFAYVKSNKTERIKMIVSGIGFGILSLIFAKDVFMTYWVPRYLIDGVYIEDFLYGFLFAGIIPSMHNIFRNKHMTGELKINYLLIVADVLILVSVFCIMVYIFDFNYIYPLSVVPLIIGIISFVKVKGDIKDVLITVGCSVIITVLVYNIIIFIYPGAIDNHFLIKGTVLLRVPLTEWLFAVCLGVGCTYTYEAIFGYK